MDTAASVTGAPSIEQKSNMQQWLAPITAMTFILGAFIGLALKAQNLVRRDSLPSPRYSGLAEAYHEEKLEMLKYQATIGSLQQTNDRLTEDVTSGTPQMKVLVDQVKQARFIAGLTPVEGPGILVTLKDSTHKAPTGLPATLAPQITAALVIHDVDIQRLLNELKAGGAEAFSINNQRVTLTTAVRCVGPAIQVNSMPITPPYYIKAIGDPSTLATSLNIQGGIADQLRSTDTGMIAIQKQDKFVLPAYEGDTQYRYARPAPLAASSQAGI